MLGVLFSFICLLLSSVISFHLLHLWSPFLTLSSLLCYSLHIVSCFLLLYLNFFPSMPLSFSLLMFIFSPLLSSINLSHLHSFLVSSLYSAFYLHLLSLPVSSCLCLVLSLFLSYHYFVCYHLVSCWSPLLTFFNPCFFSLLSTFFISFPL